MALDDANFSEDIGIIDTQNRTWATSFSLDGTSYATNLFWQPLENPDDPYADIEQASQNILEGADLFCVKKGKAPQFGICASAEGYKAGNGAAAPSLTTSLSNLSSFIAVFKTDNGWWYICVRNDIILSDGDMLFLNEEDAKTQFESMLAVPDWNKKIAPKSWALEETEELDLSTLLSRSTAPKLAKIGALRGGKLTAIFAISGFFVLWILYALIDAVFLAPPKKPKIAIAPRVIRPAPVVQKIELPAPWENLADVNVVMVKCYDAIVTLSTLISPGWEVGTIECNEESAKTSWKRNFGQVSWFKEAVKTSKKDLQSISFSDSGDNVSGSINFKRNTLKANPPQLNSTQLIFSLNNLFQSLGIKVGLSRQTHKAIKEGEKNYSFVNYSFSSTQDPLIWSTLLTKYSGVVINNITYNPSSKVWNYKGVIYVL